MSILNQAFLLIHLELQILCKWAPAVVNHLYWSSDTRNGNGKYLSRGEVLKHSTSLRKSAHLSRGQILQRVCAQDTYQGRKKNKSMD